MSSLVFIKILTCINIQPLNYIIYMYIYIYTHDSFIAIPCASSRNYNPYLVLEYSQSVRIPEFDLLSIIIEIYFW